MKDKKKILILSSIIVGVLVVVLGLTYALFTFDRIGSNSELVLGDIYMHYRENNSLDLSGVMPSSTYDTSKYFEFTIDGKNTYSDKDIYYEILVSHGDNHETKTARIKDNLLKFTLVEIKDGEEIIVVGGKSFEEINNSKIWVNTISKNTLSEVNATYRLYMWISNETMICGGKETECDYYIDTDNPELSWDNVFASIKINVRGDFEVKSYATDERCFGYSINYNEKNYTRMSLETADLVDISNDPDKIDVCANYFATATKNNPDSEEHENMVALGKMICAGQTIEYQGTNLDFDGLVYLLKLNGQVIDYEYLENEGIITNYQDNGYTYIDTTTNEQITNIEKSQASISLSDYMYTNSSCGLNVIIPREIDGIGVTNIGTGAFYNRQITSVEIPNSVTTISNSAFTNNKLKSVYIPNSVTTIGMSAFYKNQLTSAMLPNGVTTIGKAAFYENQLKSIVIPDTVTTIGDFAFYGNQLTSVMIPNGVTTIGSNTFYNNQLKSVVIPDSVTTIGDMAFYRNQLTSVTIPNGVTTIGRYAFRNNQLKSVVIPNSVTTIGEDAFAFNQLIDAELSNNVTTIGKGAFSYNQLKSVVIPNSVTTIGEDAFAHNQLKSVTISNSVITIENGVFRYNQLKSIVIPDTVTTIGDFAFYGNQLTSVVIPNGVTMIGEMAFSGNQLTSVEIPNSVTTIGDFAFSGNQLTSVTIRSGIQYIGTGVFSMNIQTNPDLESITFTSKTCSEIKNIQASSSDTTKYFPWLDNNFPYYIKPYKAKVFGTDGECSY